MPAVSEDFETAEERTEAWVADHHLADHHLADHHLAGLTEDEVVAAADTADIVVRVVLRDESGGIVSADRRSNRVNIDLVDGRVSRVRFVG